MSLGTDEAWALNGLRSLVRPPVPHLSSELIITNGGMYALLNLGVEAALSGHLWAHRLVSLLALAIACSIVLRLVPARPGEQTARWVGLAVLLAVPGLAEVGTAALGTSVGLALMLSSMALWTSPKHGVVVRAVGGGLLYGLAAASRFDLVLFGVAVLLCACVRPVQPNWIRFKIDGGALAFVAVGFGIFLANHWLMGLSAHAMAAETVSDATGLAARSLDYPKLLNQWQALVGFAPPVLIVALALSRYGLNQDESVQPQVHAESALAIDTLLVVAGGVLLLAWLFRAPIPHLRYALPGLFCFAAVGSMAMQRCVAQCMAAGKLRQLLICQCIGLACVAGAMPSLARSALLSDSDQASWEWSHETALDYFRRFDARQDQLQLVKYLRAQEQADVRVYAMLPFALRYLSERPIVDLSATAPAAADAKVPHAKRLLILSPAVGTYFHLWPESAAWLQQHATFQQQFGRYSVYRLPAGTDQDLKHLNFSRTAYRAHPGSQPWFGRN